MPFVENWEALIDDQFIQVVIEIEVNCKRVGEKCKENEALSDGACER